MCKIPTQNSNINLRCKIASYDAVKNLKTLLDFRSGYINIDGFTIDDVNNLIYTLSID